MYSYVMGRRRTRLWALASEYTMGRRNASLGACLQREEEEKHISESKFSIRRKEAAMEGEQEYRGRGVYASSLCGSTP